MFNVYFKTFSGSKLITMIAYSDKPTPVLGRNNLVNMHSQAGYLANSQTSVLRMLYPQLYASYEGNLAALALASHGQYPYGYAAQSLANHMNFSLDNGLGSLKSINLSPNSSVMDAKEDRYSKTEGKHIFYSHAKVALMKPSSKSQNSS